MKTVILVTTVVLGFILVAGTVAGIVEIVKLATGKTE